MVGAGVMGSSHARVLRQLPTAVLSAVVDPDLDRARRLAGPYGARALGTHDDLAAYADAVVVAAPSGRHVELALDLLDLGLPLLVEKPLALDAAGAVVVAEAAARARVPVLVGHVERFNAAVAEVRRWAGEALHLSIRRIGPYSPRVDADVVGDLMIHDIDLALALLGGSVEGVSAVGHTLHDAGPDLVEALLVLGRRTAALTASRIAQVKERTLVLTTADAQIVADLVMQSVTIHRMQHAEFVDDQGVRYRQSGVVETPFLDRREPLAAELAHFLDVVTGAARPLVTAEDAVRGLQVVERVRDVLSGRPVPVPVP